MNEDLLRKFEWLYHSIAYGIGEEGEQVGTLFEIMKEIDEEEAWASVLRALTDAVDTAVILKGR